MLVFESMTRRKVGSVVSRWSRQARRGAAVAAAVLLPGLIAAVPTAGAFSREGLPIEILYVPSPAMNRDIRI